MPDCDLHADEQPELLRDSAEAAKAAGLRFVSDAAPGLRRLRAGDGFEFVSVDGAVIRDAPTLERIRSLAIPPAWTDVWICPSPRGHIQATGRDQRGRKQYRYHPGWRAVRDAAKYEHAIAFGEALPAIRERVEADLRRPGLPREKVLAAVVRLLEATLIRVGNAEYARDNKHFGLTTFRTRHAQVQGAEVRFRFKGKSGKEHAVGIRDRRLARIVQQCQELPGQLLFQYVGEDGERHGVESDDVNRYLREISGHAFTAKDFRTWAGTVLAARTLSELGAAESEAQSAKQVVRAVEVVAERLGNTRAVCRACYIHPAVIEAYLDGSLLERAGDTVVASSDSAGLAADEGALLALLKRRLESERQSGSTQAGRRTARGTGHGKGRQRRVA